MKRAPNVCPECKGRCCRDELYYPVVHMGAGWYNHNCDACVDGIKYVPHGHELDRVNGVRMIDRRALYIDTQLLLDEVRRTAPDTESDSDVARTVATSLLICAAYAARGHVDAATMDRILGAEIDHQLREELAPEWARVKIHATADR